MLLIKVNINYKYLLLSCSGQINKCPEQLNKSWLTDKKKCEDLDNLYYWKFIEC